MNDSHRQLSAACTTGRHDNGFAIVAGTEVTGVHIGRIYWDASTGPEAAGLVLHIEGREFYPDDVSATAERLADHGWQLTDESVRDVETLIPGTATPRLPPSQ